MKDVKERINQHNGNGSRTTYALQLKHWFKGQYNLKVYVYDGDEYDKEVIQIIEDYLWNRLNPAFGKRGGNNR